MVDARSENIAVEIVQRDSIDPSEHSAVCAFLNENNESLGFQYAPEPLVLLLRPEGSQEIIGGLFGSTNWGWLHVSILAVSPVLRGLGFGGRLMQEAHSRARARGCHSAHLDTFSFQALGFYQGLGYEIFGTLDQFPDDEKRYFLRCKLT